MSEYEYINQELGRKGEDIVAEFYRDRGYGIIARNYRVGSDEIDIIAENERTVVFVEVKKRSSGNEGFGRPAHAVNAKKRSCLIRYARALMKRNKLDKFHRFDVVEIVLKGEDYSLNQIRNAFGADGKAI